MKKYSFLFKPIFFIFSLLFAAWLVIKIEKVSPSDFEYETPLNEKTQNLTKDDQRYYKKYLMNLCNSYKAGITDSSSLDKNLTIFLDSIKKGLSK